jgi:hypothetical protein
MKTIYSKGNIPWMWCPAAALFVNIEFSPVVPENVEWTPDVELLVLEWAPDVELLYQASLGCLDRRCLNMAEVFLLKLSRCEQRAHWTLLGVTRVK